MMVAYSHSYAKCIMGFGKFIPAELGLDKKIASPSCCCCFFLCFFVSLFFVVDGGDVAGDTW